MVFTRRLPGKQANEVEEGGIFRVLMWFVILTALLHCRRHQVACVRPFQHVRIDPQTRLSYKKSVITVSEGKMYDPRTGELVWEVDTAGYEIDPGRMPGVEHPGVLGARFFRDKGVDEQYVSRGVIRPRGGKARQYRPMEEAPGLARRLAALFPIDGKSHGPSDEGIVNFVNKYGLLTANTEMPVRDFLYTAKYLSVFASAVDNENRNVAREVFNERILPRMTVKLVGAASGAPTANWFIDVEPIDLISAAWLQMAAELTQGKKLKKCAAPDCLDWFPDRANKRFCDNRCKMSFHREQKRSG